MRPFFCQLTGEAGFIDVVTVFFSNLTKYLYPEISVSRWAVSSASWAILGSHPTQKRQTAFGEPCSIRKQQSVTASFHASLIVERCGTGQGAVLCQGVKHTPSRIAEGAQVRQVGNETGTTQLAQTGKLTGE